MRHGTSRGSGVPDNGCRMPELPRCYAGEADPMQRLVAFSYLQAQDARQETEGERQKDADCQSRVVAPRQHTAEARLSPEQSLEFIVDQARHITGADGAAIALRDSGDFICRGRSGVLTPDLGARVDPHSGISGACLREGEVQQCDDTETDSRVDPSVCRGQGIRSILAVPVRRGDVLGILAVFSGWAGVFRERDVRALSLLAGLVVAQLPQGAPGVAGVAETLPAQPGPDTTEAPHAAEPTARRDAELPPAALEVRGEAPARRERRSLKSAVLALAVLAVTSEVVVWRGSHVNEVFRMAKAPFATPTPGPTPHPNTPAITKPAATISGPQTTLKTAPGKTISPAPTPGPTRARPPQSGLGEKGIPASTTAPPGESPEASSMANAPSPRLEGPVNLHSLFAGLETILQPEVINPTASASLPGPKDASKAHENGKRALQKHKKARAEAQLQHLLEFRGVLKDHYINVRRVVFVRFAIYAQPQGGAPLWQEVQDVEVDQLGSFTAQVGATSAGGFPQFARGLWLGWLVQLPGEVERRMWLVDTLSGLTADGAVARMLARDPVGQPTSENGEASENTTDRKRIRPD